VSRLDVLSSSILTRDVVLAAPGWPDFHIVGVWMHFMHPLYTGRPSGIFRPTYPRPPVVASPMTILETLKALKPTDTRVMPSILEAWAHDPAAIRYLKTLNEIVSTLAMPVLISLIGAQRFGGGPLSPAVGDTLVAQGCRVRMVYGCTEAGFVSDHNGKHLAPEDWAWCEINPNVDVRWRPAEDGTFELEVLRGLKHVVSVENLPDVRGYATQDLWEPHPTKPGLWRMYVVEKPWSCLADALAVSAASMMSLCSRMARRSCLRPSRALYLRILSSAVWLPSVANGRKLAYSSSP
jgi:hypothetical protein